MLEARPPSCRRLPVPRTHFLKPLAPFSWLPSLWAPEASWTYCGRHPSSLRLGLHLLERYLVLSRHRLAVVGSHEETAHFSNLPGSLAAHKLVSLALPLKLR